MTADEAIEAIWEIAGNDECDGVTFTAASDQWWGVTARCRHGRFSAESNGQLDLSSAFERVWGKFRRGHSSPEGGGGGSGGDGARAVPPGSGASG